MSLLSAVLKVMMLRAILHPSSLLPAFSGTRTVVRETGKGGRCLQQQPTGGLGRPAEGSPTNQCRIHLSTVANAPPVAPAGRFGFLAPWARSLPGLARAGGPSSQDLSSQGAGWGGRFERNTASVNCSILTHTPFLFFFFFL